jgi:predicted Rossmann fold flavoprotein
VKKNLYDVIIIGAGAAGLMAAAVCGSEPLKVLLLEGQHRPGLKLLITGGGRCNISNVNIQYRMFNSSHPRTVKNAMAALSPRRAVVFFQKLGVDLHAESDGNLFPVTQKAQTVCDALLREAQKHADLRVSCKVSEINRFNEFLCVRCGNQAFYSKTVILCAGGQSYPWTGSDGSGFVLAQRLGHTIVPLIPALTPLTTDDREWKTLTGIALPCVLNIQSDSGPAIAFEGPLLFTHNGFSGPCVLNISRYWTRNRHYPVMASFLPCENSVSFNEKVLQAAQSHPRQMVKTWLSTLLPARLAEIIIKKIQIGEKQVLGQLTRKQREDLIGGVIRCPLPVSGASGYKKAEVTAGGVDLGEVNEKTLESKIVKGLFFAGEILDVDGPVGGTNLQWAWSSGYLAAHGAVNRLKNQPPFLP